VIPAIASHSTDWQRFLKIECGGSSFLELGFLILHDVLVVTKKQSAELKTANSKRPTSTSVQACFGCLEIDNLARIQGSSVHKPFWLSPSKFFLISETSRGDTSKYRARQGHTHKMRYQIPSFHGILGNWTLQNRGFHALKAYNQATILRRGSFEWKGSTLSTITYHRTLQDLCFWSLY